MIYSNKHIVHHSSNVRNVLTIFNELASDAIVFLVDDNQRLIGSITDGDIRRGLLKGLNVNDDLLKFVQKTPKCFKKNVYDFELMRAWRAKNLKIIPVLDNKSRIIDIVNFRLQKSFMPMEAIIMAGGKGTRLRPLTLKTPKPLLEIGGKPIIEYNIDRLKSYGINKITLSVKYLGEQIRAYFKDGSKKQIAINYIEEEKPLGTIGAVSLMNNIYHDFMLIMNSDLLTNVNYEDMFKTLLDKQGDMVVATTPYKVQIPYGVIETDGDYITDLKEKPTYTYYSNAGIYIMKKNIANLIPKNSFFNATDLIDKLIANGKKVVHYPILDYWLDIGKPDDFKKAQGDIYRINF